MNKYKKIPKGWRIVLYSEMLHLIDSTIYDRVEDIELIITSVEDDLILCRRRKKE